MAAFDGPGINVPHIGGPVWGCLDRRRNQFCVHVWPLSSKSLSRRLFYASPKGSGLVVLRITKKTNASEFRLPCLPHRAQVLAALIDLHDLAGIAHLDIKTSNIVVKRVRHNDSQADFYTAKLVDFGSAQVMSVRPNDDLQRYRAHCCRLIRT